VILIFVVDAWWNVVICVADVVSWVAKLRLMRPSAQAMIYQFSVNSYQLSV
jgi:hypothetical protein